MAFSLALLGASTYEVPVALGSYDLLATEILTGSQSSITFASLGDYAADYQHLQIRMSIRNDRSVGYTLGEARLRFNSITGSGNYYMHNLTGNGSNVASGGYSLTSGIDVSYYPSAPAPSQVYAGAIVDILDPFNNTKNTTVKSLSGVHTGGTGLGNDNVIQLLSGLFISTASVTDLALVADTSNFVIGSRFSLYGIRKAAS